MQNVIQEILLCVEEMWCNVKSGDNMTINMMLIVSTEDSVNINSYARDTSTTDNMPTKRVISTFF